MLIRGSFPERGVLKMENTAKDNFLNTFLSFSIKDKLVLDEIIQSLETYIAKNEYDLQLELILHTFKTTKKTIDTNCFEEICETAAPIFQLIITTDWGLVELHVLAVMIMYTPHHRISEELKQEAIDVLDDDFRGHKEYDNLRRSLYSNLSMRLLRAKYYDGADPQEVKLLFDNCMKAALSTYEENESNAIKSVLLIRKAMFYGDSKKISQHLDELTATRNKALVDLVKDSLVDFFVPLGDKLTTSLANRLKGHQIQKKRKELGISSLDFADAIGSSQTALNAVERGEKGISAGRLCKVAKILGVNVSYFFGEGEAANASVHVVTDATARKLVRLMAILSENEKTYILETARNFVSFRRKESHPSV